MTRARSANQRGVSLVEAIVAMAVMAFGMLGIVGLQATLRQNSDVAKQRSEAVRIGEEAIEQWRAFSIMGATSGASAGYASIQTPANQVIKPDATNKFNTEFTLSRTVADMPGGKTLAVTVSWTDRSNQPQSVTLNTIIAAADPALSGRLTMADTGGGAALPPQGRHPAIPMEAADRGDGTSGFKPAPGGDVIWVFDNLTGVIVGVCTAMPPGANVSSCPKDSNGPVGLPLSGFVRFATGMAQPTKADAENPTSTALNLSVAIPNLSSTGHPSPNHVCYTNAPTSYLTARQVVVYHCAILFNAGAPLKWSGRSELMPQAFEVDLPLGYVPWELAVDAADARASRYRVCRFTPASSDAQSIPNRLHPRQYTNVSAVEPLTHQNFLVIRAGDGPDTGGGTAFTCPTDVAADPAHGDFVNSNTLPHQPPPASP